LPTGHTLERNPAVHSLKAMIERAQGNDRTRRCFDPHQYSRGTADIDIEYIDIEYMERQTLRFDTTTLLGTVPAVTFGEGAR
jgi:hypothetical protein